jgi:hypothetical protein
VVERKQYITSISLGAYNLLTLSSREVVSFLRFAGKPFAPMTMTVSSYIPSARFDETCTVCANARFQSYSVSCSELFLAAAADSVA